MIWRLCLLWSLLFYLPGLSQAEPRPGETPPALRLTKLLQAPADAVVSWEAFKGKAVILEFWATWCGPCVATIPHMNSLVESFEGKPVQFLSITDESESLILRFLKKKPMKSWIGLDTDQEMMQAFGVYSIPYVLIVNPAGKVVGVFHPMEITQALIEDVLAGRPVQVN